MTTQTAKYSVTLDRLKLIRAALEHEEVVYHRVGSSQYRKAMKALADLERRYATI